MSKKTMALILFICALAAPAHAADTQPVNTPPAPIAAVAGVDSSFPGLKQKISLDIRQMDVVDFLKFLAIEGNLNIVASKDVAGPVNILINDVTIADTLEIVASMNGLAYEMKNNIIKVMTAAEYKTLYGVNFFDQRATAIFQLKYASTKNVSAMLGNVKSEIGKVISDDSTGTIILIDTPEKIKEMSEVVNRTEIPTVTRVLPTETKVFELKYARVADIKDEIAKALTPDVGTIRASARTNSLVITDLPHQLKHIESVIKAFDRKTREVFIEAKIVEVTLGDKFQWGINWDRIIELAGSARGYVLTPAVSLPLSLTGTFGKLTVDTLRPNDLDIVLEVLGTVTETKILSSPHLTVEEGKEAKIEVIEKQPYQEETTTTASGGTTTTSKTYQWVNVGVSLNVTAFINKDDYVSILIKPEVSSISTWYGGAAQAAGAVPVVKSANAQTTVMVKDGTTIIIAGLVKDNKTKTVNKIPILGDIPWIGAGFQKISDEITRTETVVFLTPRIVYGNKEFLLEKDMPKPSKGIRE